MGQSVLSHQIESAKTQQPSQGFLDQETIDILSLNMETRIVRTTILFLIYLLKFTSSRPQSNQEPQGQSSDCGRSYCEQVPDYPSKTILELLDRTNILPGTFDSIERQGKRSLNAGNLRDEKQYDLINFIENSS